MTTRKLIFNIIKNILPNKIFCYKGNINSNKIALTFDDGPFPNNTSKILDFLKKNNIKATFFMIGKNISHNKEIVKKVFKDGHEIGNHFFNHKSVYSLNYSDLKAEIINWEKIVKETININSRLIRPPYGHLDIKTFFYAWKNHLKIIYWSIDTKDLYNMPLIKVKENIENTDLKGGDIILMHEDSEYVIDLLDFLIQKALKENLSFCTVSSLFNYTEVKK